ncbi:MULTISPECIES: carph-isopro domain-containing protein [unclassified Azospirillum]|uniref:carph-isopro domain-containing protein n=1 Tax=unclassified Azospirillum TaxID=2630922 RepID=UPI0035D4BAE3
MLTHDHVISAFGGGTNMAAALEAEGSPVDREAVYKWRRNGIPPRYWGIVARAASRLGLQGITREALETAQPSKGPRVRRSRALPALSISG